MIYGILSDIHGNLTAVETVLEDMESEGVDRIICLGDIVGYGPSPLETAELMYYMAAAAVRGNHEEMVCARKIDEFVSPLAAAAARWTRARLIPPRGRRRSGRLNTKRDVWGWLKSLPVSVRHDRYLFAHGTPSCADEYIITLQDAQRVFASEMDGAQVLFVGHSHVPGVFYLNKDSRVDYAPGEPDREYRIGSRPMIVNVGSVGQPRDHDARSCYVIFDGKNLHYRRVEYDVEVTVDKIYRTKGLPNALGDRLLCGE